MRLYELAGNTPRSDTAVFTFGRLNPPTIGHAVLINSVKKVTQKHNADSFVFLSQTQKPPKDPLPWGLKTKIAERAFPDITVWKDPAIRTPFEAFGELGEDYRHIIMVVGSDRVEEFKTRMSKYVDELGLESFDVVSAGERDPDATGAKGMSASKARQLAYEGKWNVFQKALPDTLSIEDKKSVYKAIRNSAKA